MIPIRDRNPSSSVPWVVYSLIAINAVAFLYEATLPHGELELLVARFGLVPHNVTAALRGDGGLLQGVLIPGFTSLFLHGGWLHLIGNMWFLHIFGDNVEDRLRHVPFLAFYLACGLAASLLHYAINPQSPMPTIGASGAIAGVLGAYIVSWPGARIVTLLPLFYLITFVELPAFLVLGMWFIIQFFGGVGSIGAQLAGGGVAYWAHIGGFIAGAALMKLLSTRRPSWTRRREPPPRQPPLPPRYWR